MKRKKSFSKKIKATRLGCVCFLGKKVDVMHPTIPKNGASGSCKVCHLVLFLAAVSKSSWYSDEHQKRKQKGKKKKKEQRLDDYMLKQSATRIKFNFCKQLKCVVNYFVAYAFNLYMDQGELLFSFTHIKQHLFCYLNLCVESWKKTLMTFATKVNCNERLYREREGDIQCL